MLTLRIGARPSKLAVKQVEEISSKLPRIHFKTVGIVTEGDRDKVTPLSETEGTDFFTRELEDALLSGRIDVAIHSAKDLEATPPDGLIIVATTASISSYDCLVSRRGEPLEALPAGSIIGTSSIERKGSILSFRKDLIVKDIRGDIDERLEQLDKGDFDAIIIAHAALIRLGYEARATQIIPKELIEPHPLQGRLAAQVRRDRKDLIDIFGRIDAN